MEPITLRVPSELLDELDQEATDAGFSSRSEYIRYVLQHRSDSPEVATTNGEHAIERNNYAQVVEQINELKHRIELLEKAADESMTEDVFTALDEWLDAELQSESAQTVMLAAAEILRVDGPLATAELRERLFDRHPDAYSSASAL